jgi:hypothetical protein
MLQTGSPYAQDCEWYLHMETLGLEIEIFRFVVKFMWHIGFWVPI